MVNSNKVKGRIVELGLNQQDVAKAMGLSQSTLSLKINNARPMALSEVEELAKLLQLKFPEYEAYFFYHPVA